MDANRTRRLIKTMLDSRSLMPETREELAEYLADLDKGELHADDAAYIEGLARRLGHAAGGAPANSNAPDDTDDTLPDEFRGHNRGGGSFSLHDARRELIRAVGDPVTIEAEEF